MSDAYDKMRKERDALKKLVQEQHAMIEEIAVAFENGTTSLSPNFLAHHIAVLRVCSVDLAEAYRQLECESPNILCSECNLQCPVGRCYEAFDTFITQRDDIANGR